MMENMLRDFARDIFKKTVSPYKKWAYVEAFACYVMCEDMAMCLWMGEWSSLLLGRC